MCIRDSVWFTSRVLLSWFLLFWMYENKSQCTPHTWVNIGDWSHQSYCGTRDTRGALDKEYLIDCWRLALPGSVACGTASKIVALSRTPTNVVVRAAAKKAWCAARCLYAMLYNAVLLLKHFSILVAVPAVFVEYRERNVVISCKLYNNIASIYCVGHKLTSTWGEGQLTLDSSTQNTLTLFHFLVHLVLVLL